MLSNPMTGCWSNPGLVLLGSAAVSCGACFTARRAVFSGDLWGKRLPKALLRGPLSCTGSLKVNASAAAAVPPATITWTPAKAALSVFLFMAAGLAEIAGGWLIWQAIKGRWAQQKQHFLKNKKSLASIAAGSCCLVAYGFIPTMQPSAAFGRLYAVYGGFFVLLSYAWGWAVDGDKPDKGDWIGACVAITGVALAWFWPR